MLKKIGTISINPLESTKVAKNRLKTNSKNVLKARKKTQNEAKG
jgi:hypothetical protein